MSETSDHRRDVESSDEPGTVASASGTPPLTHRRLHPLSPLLRGIKTVGLVVAAVSWQGFARFGLGIGAIIIVATGVLGLAWSWISWYYTGFEVAAGQLRITEGALFRRHRTIPLERLQSVEVVQPLLARLLRLAELRCEVVGASRTEAPLAYLTLADAGRLRQRLLELSQVASTGTETETDGPDRPDDAAPDEEPSEASAEPSAPAGEDGREIVAVDTGRLIQSQLLSPEVLFLPFAAAGTVLFFV